MRLLYSSPNVALVNHYRSVLHDAGIPCVVRGEYLSAAVGEIPPIEAWAELWVVDPGRFDDAARWIADLEAAPQGSDWECPSCGECNEAAFAACWRCGATNELTETRAS